MRNSLFMYCFYLILLSTSCSPYKRPAEVVAFATKVTTGVPKYDLPAMLRYYESLPPAQRKYTEMVRLNYNDVSDAIKLMTRFGYKFTLLNGVFNEQNAVLYATYYSTATNTITPQEIENMSTFVIEFSTDKDTLYMATGKVCPPPPTCD